MTAPALPPNPLAGPVLAIALLALGIVPLAWRKRHEEPGSIPLAVYLLTFGVGTLTVIPEMAATEPGTKLLWWNLGRLSQSILVGSWLYFALTFAGRTGWTGRRLLAVLAVEPLVVAVTTVVPPLRTLVMTLPASVESGPRAATLATGVGPLGLLHGVYVLVVALIASTILAAFAFRTRYLGRVRGALVVLAAFLPWGVLILNALVRVLEFDVTIFVWPISGALMTAVLYRYGLLDPVPTSRSTVIERMSDGVVVLDGSDRIREMNPAARDLLGAAGDPVGETLADYLAEWDPAEAASADGWCETSVRRDGRTLFLETECSRLTDQHGRGIGLLVVVRDVTDRKKRERDLARYKTIFESVEQPVYVLDQDDEFVMVNEPFARLVGIDREDLVGAPFRTVLPDGSDAEITDPDLDPDEPVEMTIESASRGTIPCETRGSRISFDGSLSGTVGFIRDISRRKRIEYDLAETTRRYETVIEACPLAIVAFDEEGAVERWNPAASETFGWSESDVFGTKFDPIAGDVDLTYDDLRERVAERGRITGLETVLERRDGSRFDASLSIAPITDRDGNRIGCVAVVSDISDRKERERELRRTNERLDQFASIVSHDLRNPLNVADGHAKLALETGDLSHLETVTQAHERMSSLIDDVLTVAREGREVEDPEPTDLAAVARRAWDLVETEGCRLDVDDSLGTVRSDSSRLSRLFENLFRNSVEHGSTGNREEPDDSVEHGSTGSREEPDDGTGEDSTDSDDVGEGNREDGRSRVTVTVGQLDDRPGFYVADDGPGIPPEEREHVFEFGFSGSDGTGLGLAIVEMVAEAHGWSVSVTEGTAGGARFEFTTGGSRSALGEAESEPTPTSGGAPMNRGPE